MQQLISAIVNSGNVILVIGAIVVGVFAVMNRGFGALGKVALGFIVLLLLFQCMAGKIKPEEAGRKIGEQFDPTQIGQEAAKRAEERSQAKRNNCLRTTARNYGLDNIAPQCASQRGRDYETCMRQNVLAQNPAALGAARKECDLGGVQGELDELARGYAMALVRAVLLCPYSGLDLCTDSRAQAKATTQSTPYQKCLTEAVTKMNLGARSQQCAAATTAAAWESCMRNVLCQPPGAKTAGCAWTNHCAANQK